METFMTFIYVLAWIAAVGGTFFTVCSLVAQHQYNHGGTNGGPSLEKLTDRLHNKKTTWKYGKFVVAAVIGWCWIIANFLQA